MPIIIYLLLFIILLGVILIFSSKRFSPIPYFPTQKIDLPLIIKSLYLKSDQLIVDLGAGDGIVIFEAAKEAYKKKLNTEFLAVEINPILILLLRLRRYFHPNKKSIKILKADIFNMNFKNLSFPRKRESILSWIPHQVRNDSQKVEQYN
ncbi:hypothetical protein HY612_04880, partial [Candidatus Roizmanbacteria bacterium]|nr:hypothetical protein [Candidatus Roizmanbacteria bacterium]